MAKAKKEVSDVKLPKFLKLNKGMMWLDVNGTNCSNVKIYNVTEKAVGRKFISDEEYQQFLETGFTAEHEIPKDDNSNASSQFGEYGYVKLKEDESYFDTTNIDKSKLSNIITAYNNKVLVAYDPTNVVTDDGKTKDIKSNFSFKKNSQNGTDGDIIFTGKNKAMFNKLQNSNHDELIKFIKGSSISGRSNLMDLYDYELSGYNRLDRPRHSVLDAIKSRLNDLGPGMSGISVEPAYIEAEAK